MAHNTQRKSDVDAPSTPSTPSRTFASLTGDTVMDVVAVKALRAAATAAAADELTRIADEARANGFFVNADGETVAADGAERERLDRGAQIGRGREVRRCNAAADAFLKAHGVKSAFFKRR